MDETLVIRNGDIDDIEAIGYLAHQVWPGTYGKMLSAAQIDYMLRQLYRPETLRKNMLEEQHHFLIAEINLNEVGFAAYSELNPGQFKLHKIYVLPATQGKGVGRALLETVYDSIREQHGNSLILNVNRHNDAREFYERQGFVVIRSEDIDIGEGFFMNDFVMEKKMQ